MIKLQRPGHVLIAARDLERSKDFDTRILGFKVLELFAKGRGDEDKPLVFSR